MSAWNNFVEGIYDFIGNIGSYISNIFQAPEKNYNLQKEQYEYQKELNQTTMDREDTSYQRQVADLKAAGLSPLMVSGGASAQPLQAGNAPQQDFSQVTSAIHNMFGAFNDIFNRQLNRRQFRLQQQVQTAEMYTKLREFELYKKRQEKEMDILDLDYKYFLNHPERNLGLQQAFINALSRYLPGLPNSVNPLPDIKLPTVGNGNNGLFDLIPGSGSYQESTDDNPISSFAAFGAVPKTSKYGHTLDNENYDNDRSTLDLLKQEAVEKYYKGQILTALKGNNKYDDLLVKLYKNDDYLKKHISLENWKNVSESFLRYYLKNGQFEGHKKYFD